MNYSKMQSIDYMLNELGQHFKRDFKIVILWNSQLWTADFLNTETGLPRTFEASSYVESVGSVRYDYIRITQQDPRWQAIYDYRQVFFKKHQYSQEAMALGDTKDASAAYKILTDLYERVTSENELPEYVYNLVSLDNPELTLPVAVIPENDFKWVSILIEDLPKN